jgi:hypothetical protein
MIRFWVAAALMVPAAAIAQGNPGPYGGLFGRAPAGADKSTTVEARAALGGQYDSAILAPQDTSSTATQSGLGSLGNAALTFERETDKFNASAGAAAGRSQYFVTPAYAVNFYGANATISSAITKVLHADAAAAYTHSPYFQLYQPFSLPSVIDASVTAATPFTQYASEMLENETVYASAGLTARLTERNRLSASASRRQTLFSESSADLVSNGYQALWTYQLRRDLGVRAGYGREHVTQHGELGQDYDSETIDVGVDFTRSFSLARRTTFGFSTSTSLIKTGTSPREFRLNGSAFLAKHFRRTWHAAAHFSRATSFLPGFYEPLYSDSVGVSLGGMFSNRLDWGFSADAVKGESAFTETSGFNSVRAASTLTFALNRYLGLRGQYAAYGYEIPENSNVLGLSDRLSRQTIWVGVSAYIPVYKKMGK